jgi:low affinity Fe/Cu permease
MEKMTQKIRQRIKERTLRLSDKFRAVATQLSNFFGSSWFFLASIVALILWVSGGPHFHWSEGYQMPVNTVLTVLTYLIAILIQNTQTRETRAIQLKLDGIISALDTSQKILIRLESLPDEDLERIDDEFKELRERIDNECGD